jgi:hypothetical protein
VRGGHHTHIHLHRFQATHRINRSLLQHTQQFDLHVQRQISNFVQENGAAVSQLKPANAIGHGPREGTLAMAKKLTLQQIFGDGRAIDGNKISATPVGLIVQSPGHQLFARATFTGN